MMKANLFKSISIVAQDFVYERNNYLSISPRGSNILLFSLIVNLKKKYGIHFEIYQPGRKNRKMEFEGISINVIESSDFSDFKNQFNKLNFNSSIIHYNNIDLFSGGFPNVYITATIHTNAFLEKVEAKKWLKKSLKKFNDVVVVNTQYVKEFQDVRLIKNGISQDIFKYDSKTKKVTPPINILFPNLNTPKKNRDFAVDLVRKLNQRGRYDFKLILTGEQERLPLKDEEYEFVGEKKWGKEMNMLYRDSFITIIPSKSESCSLCALESMSSGTVVIANDIYGISDYIENDINGYLININNLNSWIDRIFTLVENEKEYSRIQANARNSIIKEYNLERMSNEYYSMWLKLFENRNE